MTRAYPNEHLGSVIIAPSVEVPDPAAGTSAGREVPSFWMTGHFKLFISHISAEKTLASEVAAALYEFGVSGFVAHDDIEPTKEWVDEITLALNTMDACLALLTSGFNGSNWTDQEVGVAVGRGALDVPVKLGLDPYGLIGRFQAFIPQGREPSEIAFGVARILATHRLTRLKMAHALVASFEKSTSFADAKAKVGHLALASTMPAALRDRVRAAAENNGQISNAWGVPERVESILAKFEE